MQDLNNYPLIYKQPVIWGDMDAFGHLNNVMYYRYIESARIAYLEKFNVFSKGLITVISKSSCQYLHPVFYPDTLIIGVRVEELRNSAIRMSYSLFSENQQQSVAFGEAVLVCLDQKTHQKKAIPDELRKYIIKFESDVGNQLEQPV